MPSRQEIPKATDRRTGAARRGANTLEDGDVTPDELEFLKAMDAYKRKNSRPFPTWREVLDVLRSLGYRKAAEPSGQN